MARQTRGATFVTASVRSSPDAAPSAFSHRRRVPVLWRNGRVEDVSWSDFAGLACGSRGHLVHAMACDRVRTGCDRTARPPAVGAARPPLGGETHVSRPVEKLTPWRRQREGDTTVPTERRRTACKRRPAFNAAARRHARTQAPHHQAPDDPRQADEGRSSPASTEGGSSSQVPGVTRLRQPAVNQIGVGSA